MIMIVNNGRWSFGFLGRNAAFPDHLKMWLGNLGNEELRVHMLCRWLINHEVHGMAWINDDCRWTDWSARRIVRQFNRQMKRCGMDCGLNELL